MKNLFIILSFLISFSTFSQNTTCGNMAPMCDASGVTFPAQTTGSATSGNNYSCLYSQPNPSWFFVQISNTGPIDMTLSAAHDIDFIIYGPFPDQATAAAGCGNMGNGGSGGSVIDCSYSATANETPSIPNAQAGQVYVILVTNYSGTNQPISLVQSNSTAPGAGSLDCAVLSCSVSAITATIGACSPYTNNFNITGTVTIWYPPATGQLIIENCNGVQTVVNGPFTSGTVPFVMNNLPSGSGACSLHAYFTTDPTCEKTVNYNAPPSCNYCLISSVSAVYTGNDCQGVWSTDVTTTFLNPPTTGDLVVKDCAGNISVIASAPFTSPFTGTIHTVQGTATAHTCNLQVYFTVGSCSYTKATTVPATTLISINGITKVDVNCNSASNGSATIAATGAAEYSIDLGTTFQTSNIFNNLSAGVYDVVVRNTTGCTDTSQFTILQPDPIQISDISPDSAICNGATIQLSANAIGGNGVYIYEWINNGTVLSNSSTFSVTPTADNQNYCVIVSEACGSPADTACVLVTFTPPVPPTLGPDDLSGCYPVEVNFTNLSPIPNVDHVTYDFGDGNKSIINGNGPAYHNYQSPGDYDVRMTITTVENCIYDSIYTNYIHVFGYPKANFNYSPTTVPMFDPKVDLINSSSYDVVSWNWSMPGAKPDSSTASDPSIKYPEGDVKIYDVKLIVTNADGCKDSIVRQIPVVSDVIIYAPNAFTPDGDDFNQNWRVYTQGVDPNEFTLLIFNRWGETMWESHDVNAAWDGTYGGKIAPDGTYIWIIHAKSAISDQKYEYKGQITILR